MAAILTRVAADANVQEGVCTVPLELRGRLGLESCDCICITRATSSEGLGRLVRPRDDLGVAVDDALLLAGGRAPIGGCAATVRAVMPTDVQEWKHINAMPLVPVPSYCLPSADDVRLHVGKVAASNPRHPWSATCHCSCALVRDGMIVEMEVQLHGGTALVPFALSAVPHVDSQLYARARGLDDEVCAWGYVSAWTTCAVVSQTDGDWAERQTTWPEPALASAQLAPARLVHTCGSEGARLRALVRGALLGEWAADVPPPTTILLSGPAGSGKRALVREIGAHARAAVHVLDATELCAGEPALAVRTAVVRSRERACVLIVDGLELLAPVEASTARTSDELARLAALVDVLRELDELANTAPVAARPASRLVVVGVCQDACALHPLLRDAWADALVLQPPSPDERLDILRSCLREQRLRLRGEGADGDDDAPRLRPLAQRLHGYVGADLSALAREARGLALDRLSAADAMALDAGCESIPVDLAELEAAARLVPPSSLRDLDGARPHVPEVRWSDVGGLHGAKAALEELLVWPHRHSALLDALGVRMAHGVLLYGPPGTGKTLLAQAMACESHLNFVCVQIPELVKGDVGGSEAAISAVFAKAREFAPSLLFLDELQAMFGARPTGESGGGGGGGGGAHKSLAQLLIEMDLCRSAAPYQRVALVGATNVPEALDPSLLQPGRFEHVLLIGPPDRSARAEILASALRRVPLAPRAEASDASSSTGAALAAEVLAEAYADRTDGFSAADLRSLCHAAVYRAIGEGAQSLEPRHLEQALQVFQPSITPEMMDRLCEWEARFHST